MQVRCPSCRNVFATPTGGPQNCPTCGALIHVPDAPVQGAGPSGWTGAPPGSTPGETGTGGAGQPPGWTDRGFGGGAPPGGPAPTLARGPTPWERRGELGFLRAAALTLKEGTLAPQTFWPSVEPRRSWGEALLWGWLMNAAGLILGLPLVALQWSAQLPQLREALSETAGQNPEAQQTLERLVSMAESWGVLTPILLILGTVLLWPLFSLVGIGIFHLLALLVGAGKNGFEATARAWSYAQGPQLLQVVPLAGTLAQLYAYVLFAWGLKELQETSWGKAIAVLLLPLVLICCCVCGGAMVFGGVMGAAMGAAGQ